VIKLALFRTANSIPVVGSAKQIVVSTGYVFETDLVLSEKSLLLSSTSRLKVGLVFALL